MVSLLERSSARNCSAQIGREARTISLTNRNWLFLGDSLTEGIGSQRISHVTELVKQFRLDVKADQIRRINIHYIGLRSVDPANFDPFVQFNLAGQIDFDVCEGNSDALCIWNLACEGRTIETDLQWLPLIATLKPELVVILRGGLESIIRPAMLIDSDWPPWVPRSWRSYSALDPRCYFSSTAWRCLKQKMVDNLKQRARNRLLSLRPGKPLMDLECFVDQYQYLLIQLDRLRTRILILGLLPVGKCFPGSEVYFERVNGRIRELASKHGAEFCDWAAPLKENGYDDLFYRDTFHPNAEGAKELAHILRSHLLKVVNA